MKKMECCFCESTNIEPVSGTTNAFHCRNCGRSWVRTPAHPPLHKTSEELLKQLCERLEREERERQLRDKMGLKIGLAAILPTLKDVFLHPPKLPPFPSDAEVVRLNPDVDPKNHGVVRYAPREVGR